MFKKFLSLFKSKKEESKEYTDLEEFYLIKKGYTRQDIEDYFYKVTYIRDTSIPFRCSYFITSRLYISYMPDYGTVDIYFNGIKYPVSGNISIDNYFLFVQYLRNDLLKGELLHICCKHLPIDILDDYFKHLEQLGKDLHEHRMQKFSQSYKSKHFS